MPPRDEMVVRNLLPEDRDAVVGIESRGVMVGALTGVYEPPPPPPPPLDGAATPPLPGMSTVTLREADELFPAVSVELYEMVYEVAMRRLTEPDEVTDAEPSIASVALAPASL